MDLPLLARYPFLTAAREYIRTQGYRVGELLSDPTFERSRRRAVERARGSLARDGIPEAPIGNDSEAEIELLSYPLARMILAQLRDAYLTGRYAVAESKLFSRRMVQEEGEGTTWVVAQALEVPLEPNPADGAFARVHFLDYLRYAPTRDPQWKLVNQPLSRGYVALDRDRATRLLEEAVRERLLEDLDTLEPPGREVTRALSRDLNELSTLLAAHRVRFQQEATGEIRLEAFPPCMQVIWASIQTHQNVPHMGRFAIVAFLHKLGMDSEEILKFFSNVPDFDVNKSRYQIEHITGKIGGGTEYTPPNCASMQTYGICPLDQRDEICLYRIKHPLSYYRYKLKRLGPVPTTPALPAPEVAPEATHGR